MLNVVALGLTMNLPTNSVSNCGGAEGVRTSAALHVVAKATASDGRREEIRMVSFWDVCSFRLVLTVG